jgi:hypothetical protein
VELSTSSAGAASKARASRPSTLSRSSITMRSAVLPPTPGMPLNAARFCVRTASIRRGAGIPERIARAIRGPILLMPISSRKATRSRSVQNP